MERKALLLRIDPRLWQDLEAWAAEELRSVNGQIEYLLKQAVLKRKGCVLIPTFALGSTQEILALLALLMRAGRLKPQPVYIGGLGRVFTEIYDLDSHRTHRQHSNLQLHEALNLQVLEHQHAYDITPYTMRQEREGPPQPEALRLVHATF